MKTVLAVSMAIAIGLAGCAAQFQKHDEVAIREPGHRFLGEPQPAQPEAEKVLHFAWLAEAAYGNTPGGFEQKSAEKQEKLDAESGLDQLAASASGSQECPVSQDALRSAGWKVWPDFPNDGLLEQIGKYHLRVEVWFHPQRAQVAVAFGGTVFNSHNDWMSNLRWFLPDRDDQYTQTVKRFAPAFVAEYQAKLQSGDPEWAFLRKAKIYSTGHSLGGGLAQQFAYALPLNGLVPRVDHVYAFDPSPVTGYFSVPKDLREENSKNLAIDRVYERGEILAIVRSLTSVLVKPSESQPTIRGVRFSLLQSNAIAGHSMTKLACKLRVVSEKLAAEQVTRLETR